jgi:hypothetical protein
MFSTSTWVTRSKTDGKLDVGTPSTCFMHHGVKLWNTTGWSRIPKTLSFLNILIMNNGTEYTLVPYERGRLGDFGYKIQS